MAMALQTVCRYFAAAVLRSHKAVSINKKAESCYFCSEKPTAAFPGALAVKAFPNIFKSADNNNPNINVKLSKDICNQKDAKVHLTIPRCVGNI